MVQVLTERDRAYSIIQAELLNYRWPPGSRLVESKLCQELGLGRTPVREAFGKLEKDGLLERVPGFGIFVKKLNKQEILDLYEVRGGLEGTAAGLAALRATAEDLDKLRQALKRMEDAPKKGGEAHIKECAVADTEFHYQLVRASHNNKLVDLISMCHVRATDFPSLRREKHQEQLRKHREIFDCIAAGDSIRAEKMVRKHISTARSRMEESLKGTL